MPIITEQYKKWLQFARTQKLSHFAKYLESDDAIATIGTKDPKRIASLLDTLIQTLAIHHPNSPILKHALYRLIALTHEMENAAPSALKNDNFHKRKLAILSELASMSQEELDAQPEVPNCGTWETSLNYSLHGTARHVAYDQPSIIDTTAWQLPGINLCFNGPNAANVAQSSAQCFSSNETLRGIERINEILYNEFQNNIKRAGFTAFSRGAVTAARALSRERNLGRDWQYYLVGHDPVAASTSPEAKEEGRHLPENCQGVIFRASDEVRPMMVAYSTERMKCGHRIRNYSPFEPPSHIARLEQKLSGVETMMLRGKHNTSTLARQSDEHETTARALSATTELATRAALSVYRRAGILEKNKEYHFDVPVSAKRKRRIRRKKATTKAERQKQACQNATAFFASRATPLRHPEHHVTKIVFSPAEQEKNNLLCSYASACSYAQHAEHFDFNNAQSIQPQPDSFVSLSRIAAIDRYEKLAVGSYGTGPVYFLNRQHFDAFYQSYPNMAQLLNPNNPLAAKEPDLSALKLELDEFCQAQLQKNPANIEEKQFSSAALHYALEHQAHRLDDGDFTTWQAHLPEPKTHEQLIEDRAQKKTFLQLKATFQKACQSYIHKHWGDRRRWFKTHGGAGVERALVLQKRLKEAKDSKSVLAAINQTLADHGNGNWNSDSLKNYLFHTAEKIQDKGIGLSKKLMARFSHHHQFFQKKAQRNYCLNGASRVVVAPHSRPIPPPKAPSDAAALDFLTAAAPALG